MELRPALVVAPVRVRPALEQQPDELELVRHPEQVVAVRSPLPHEIRITVEQPDELLAAAGPDRPIGLA